MPGRVTKHAAAVGLLALAAADVVLIVFALQAGAGPGPATTTVEPGGTTVGASEPTPGPTGSGAAVAGDRAAPAPSSPSSTQSAATGSSARPSRGAAAAGRLMIVAVGGDTAWRVSGGTCDAGGATIRRTTDAGATWHRVRSPLPTLTRLQPRGQGSAFVVGADDSCQPQLRSTQDKGASWADTAPASLAWHLDPRDPRQVGAPGAGTSTPCAGQQPVTDFAPVGNDAARVLCADGTVLQTSTDGATWSQVGRAAHALAIAVSPADTSRTYAVRTGGEDCAGVQLLQVAQPTRVLSCAEVDGLPSGARASLSMTEQWAWLAVDDQVLRSSDLVTWTVAGSMSTTETSAG